MAEKTGLIPLRAKISELEQVYLRIQKEIGMTLLSVDTTNFRELSAIKAQEKVDALIRSLNKMSIRWVKASVPMAYEKSYVVAKTSLEILGAKKDEFISDKIHRVSIDDYIEATMKDLVNANQSIKNNVRMYLYIVRRASAGLAQIQSFTLADDAFVEEIIMDTIEMGRERAYASNRIHDYLKLQLLDGKFISKAGRNYNLKDYSKMVARTRLRQAQTNAVKNTSRQYGNDLVQWSRHAMPCPECAQYEGKIFSLSGMSSKYPPLFEEPPLHPNCEHDLSPTSEVAIEYREAYT